MELLAAWVQAVAAVAALYAAWRAVVEARRLYTIESERDRIQSQRELRAQASCIHAWIAVHFDIEGRRHDGLVIENASSGPIYQTTISSTNKEGDPEPHLTLHIVPPGRYFAGRETASTYHWSFPDPVDSLEGIIRPVMKKPTWAVTELSFRDAAGNEWARSKNGEITTLSEQSSWT